MNFEHSVLGPVRVLFWCVLLVLLRFGFQLHQQKTVVLGQNVPNLHLLIGADVAQNFFQGLFFVKLDGLALGPRFKWAGWQHGVKLHQLRWACKVLCQLQNHLPQCPERFDSNPDNVALVRRLEALDYLSPAFGKLCWLQHHQGTQQHAVKFLLIDRLLGRWLHALLLVVDHVDELGQL